MSQRSCTGSVAAAAAATPPSPPTTTTAPAVAAAEEEEIKSWYTAIIKLFYNFDCCTTNKLYKIAFRAPSTTAGAARAATATAATAAAARAATATAATAAAPLHRK